MFSHFQAHEKNKIQENIEQKLHFRLKLLHINLISTLTPLECHLLFRVPPAFFSAYSLLLLKVEVTIFC